MLNIYWLRNDLRLDCNRVLQRVFDKKAKVIFIFILDEKLIKNPLTSKFRLSFMVESLEDLNSELERCGSELLIINQDYSKFFKELSALQKIKVYTSTDYTTYSKNRDRKVKEILEKNGCKFKSIKNNVLYDVRDRILTKSNEPYKIFTPFKKVILERLYNKSNLFNFTYDVKKVVYKVSEVDSKFSPFLNNKKVSLTELSKYKVDSQFKGGTKEAQKIWKEFKKSRIKEYDNRRDYLFLEGTSKLSAHFKWGTISVYEVVKDCISLIKAPLILEEGTYKYNPTKCKNSTKGIATYLSEIIWRDFYKSVLMYFPHVERRNFYSKYDKVKWLDNEEDFKKWCEGKTGYPIIDACMRQLNKTGWMHNRGRMIVASFLTKDLHVHWKKGEKYFQSKLIDYDLSSNNGGWQWAAGTGTDASPYFRVFNPITQGERFDKNGEFIRMFVEELKDVPEKYIHEPWEMSKQEQQEHNCIIGKDYESPIIDHKLERERTLKFYTV